MAYRIATRSAARLPRRFIGPAALGPRTFSSTATSWNGEQANEGQATPEEQPKKKGGMLRSILHGSDQAKSEGDHMQSHSTTVGRSKYIHEIQSRFCRRLLAPGGAQNCLQSIR